MNDFVGMIYILTLILLVGLLVGLLVLVIKNVGRYVHQRRARWILGGYFMILLASLFVLHMLPKEKFSGQNMVSEKTFEQAERAYNEFYIYNAALEGRLEQADGVYKSNQWDFEFSGNRLRIDDYFDIMIIAEKKDSNDGKIEVINYATKTIIKRIEVTDKIKPPKVSLEENRLIIFPPEFYNDVTKYCKVEISKFNKDFVVAQILEQERHFFSDFDQTVIGLQALYLRIPKDVEIIEDTNLNIQFVTKE